MALKVGFQTDLSLIGSTWRLVEAACDSSAKLLVLQPQISLDQQAGPIVDSEQSIQ